MKLTERLGPKLSGVNHRGFRYTPKQVVRRGLGAFHGGQLGVSQADLAEMVTEFRQAFGRDPEILFHSGLMHSGIEVFANGPAIWLKQKSGQESNWLE